MSRLFQILHSLLILLTLSEDGVEIELSWFFSQLKELFFEFHVVTHVEPEVKAEILNGVAADIAILFCIINPAKGSCKLFS